PVDEGAVRRAREVGPAVVDVLPERRRRVVDLAVDDQVDEVLELGLVQPAVDEADLQRRLLATLGEVPLFERQPQLSLPENEVLAGVVVASTRRVHAASASYARLLPGAAACT